MNALWEMILRMSLGGSIAIAAVLAARLMLLRAPRRLTALLWLAVLFRLLCPVSLPAPVGVLPQGSLPPLEWNAPKTEQHTASTNAVAAPQAPKAAVGNDGAPGLPAAEARQAFQWKDALPWLWLLGALALLLYGWGASLALGRRLRTAVHREGNVYEYAGDTPFVRGLLRPRIYLPPGLCEPERGHILAHEQSHIRRGDHIVKPLAYLALCIHWFNPLVWLFFRLLERDLEMACDERVVRRLGGQGRQQYSRSLLALAVGHRAPGGPLHFSEGDASARIRRVLWYKRPKVWLLAIALVAVAALGVFLCLDRQKPAYTDDQVLALASQALEPDPAGHFADLRLDGAAYRIKPADEAFGRTQWTVELGDTVTKRQVGDDWYTVPLLGRKVLGGEAIELGADLVLVLDGGNEPKLTQASVALGNAIVTGQQGELTFLDASTGMILRLPERWREDTAWMVDEERAAVLSLHASLKGNGDGETVVPVLTVTAKPWEMSSAFEAGTSLGWNDTIRVACWWDNAIQHPEDCPEELRARAQQFHTELDSVVEKLIRDNDLTQDDTFNPDSFGKPVADSGGQGDSPRYSAEFVQCPVGSIMTLNQGQWSPSTEIYYNADPVALQITDSTGMHDFTAQVAERMVINPCTDYYLLAPLRDENGEDVWTIVLMDEGPSSDPEAFFFRYEGGELEFLGSIPTDVHDVENAFPGDGRVHGQLRLGILQTWYAPAQWELRDGSIQQVEQDIYQTDWTGGEGSPCRLLEPLPIYAQRDDAQPSGEMQPQQVEFPATDNREWVQIRGADGTEGWFRVEDYMNLPDLGKYTTQVFENLWLAD